MNSSSTMPPRACFRFQGSALPCSLKMRSRIARTALASSSRSRGRASASRDAASTFAARSGSPATTRARVSACSSQVWRGLELVTDEGGERGGDRADVPRGAQPGVDLVELALRRLGRDGGDEALAEPGVIGGGGQRAGAVGGRAFRRVVDEDEVEVGAGRQLARAELAEAQTTKAPPAMRPCCPTSQRSAVGTRASSVISAIAVSAAAAGRRSSSPAARGGRPGTAVRAPSAGRRPACPGGRARRPAARPARP